METHSSQFKIRLGLFVAGGFLIFALAIFLIGRQKNLFNPTFTLSTTFRNVSGMQVGNHIRFSGINVGTIDDIKIINDSTVQVRMIIQKSVQPFIKSDCKAVIGSEGIIGDRILVISQGSSNAPTVKEGQMLLSAEPVELDAIIQSLSVTALNAEVITDQLSEIMVNINQGQGTLGMLIQDTTIAENINSTIINLKKSSKGLNQNMEAAKNNFLLRGYFKKKEREAARAKEAAKKAQDVDNKKKK
ncbi:MAG: MlaD family protein [Candidatus Saccharibacteria bacterium]